MASLYNAFVDCPSIESLDRCRKVDLIAVGEHFGISVDKQSTKAEIRAIVLDALLERNVLQWPVTAELFADTPDRLSDTASVTKEEQADNGLADGETEAPVGPVFTTHFATVV
ncbi:hypothetical protein DPEC_G00018970 [Dallia pectoralis]|uniref:Uncharacterized protein n=1 Tax=Dallia pectoralis TaxID=75939 RepID=A0ACC2HGE9_DALPE|nr:hypothetical protein DPEC_G00018970 [Dallia pectoralis]